MVVFAMTVSQDIGQIYSISGGHIEMPYNKKQKRKWKIKHSHKIQQTKLPPFSHQQKQISQNNIKMFFFHFKTI